MTFSQDIIEELRENLKNKEKQREGLLDQLSLIDVSIDKIDTIIGNIDSQIPPLLNQINTAIDAVKAAYDNRIAIGCRSNLVWQTIPVSDRFSFGFTSPSLSYRVVKNDLVKISTPYYAYKYYRKPTNRDYGYNLSAVFTGNISVGSTILGVVSVGGTTNIQLGDEIADDIEAPSIFSVGALPAVVGFGSTLVIGVSTTFEGTISVGSSILASVGVGTTGDILIGSGIAKTGILQNDTSVVGYGTTSITISYYDAGISSFISSSVTTQSLILSKISVASTSFGLFDVGIVTSVPSLLLSTSANASAYNQSFSAIRKTEEIDSDFDFSKNPVDPITIGTITSSNLGLGHQSLIVNNGAANQTVQWNEVKEDPEPAVGGGSAIYYSGTTQWPIYTLCTQPGPVCSSNYGLEGFQLVGVGSTGAIAGYASTSSLAPSVGTCNAATAAIAAAEAALTAITNENLPKANQLAAQAAALRRIRDEKELEAWSLLQGSAYTRKEINQIKDDLNSLTSTDFSQFE